jgi:hypothetical protein
LFTPIRRTRLGAVVVMAALLLVASALSAAAATTVKSAASSSVLGTPKKATGTAITIGIVGDGKNDTLDDTDRLNTAAAVVKYANAYRGGLNGHVIKIDQCVTHNTPSGGTQCGVGRQRLDLPGSGRFAHPVLHLRGGEPGHPHEPGRLLGDERHRCAHGPDRDREGAEHHEDGRGGHRPA